MPKVSAIMVYNLRHNRMLVFCCQTVSSYSSFAIFKKLVPLLESIANTLASEVFSPGKEILLPKFLLYQTDRKRFVWRSIKGVVSFNLNEMRPSSQLSGV